MTEIITIEPATLDWGAAFFIVVVGFILFAVGWLFDSDIWPSWLGVIIGDVLVAAGIVWLVINASLAAQTAGRQAVTLQDTLGLNPVSVKEESPNNTFTGRAPDGTYVSGELVEKDTDVYIVLLDDLSLIDE